MKINAIITGTTGMVGEGVLHECLKSDFVESVLVVNRKPCGVNHPKLKEIIHQDFSDLSAVENNFVGYNACYFCSGVSSVGKKESDYKFLTYDLTMSFAKSLQNVNEKTKTNFTFCYVSGLGTDSTEKGKQSWARVKGKTENDLLKLGFKQSFMFRPGYLNPTKGLKNTLTPYKFLNLLYPLIEKLFPNYVGTLEELGRAMINATLNGYEKNVLECADIRKLSKK